MKYPMINKQPRREVNIPELSGGLNLRDNLTGVRDNQLTDCLNMWYKDGMLRTRPMFDTSCGELEGVFGNSLYERKNAKVHSEITYNDAVLVSFQIAFFDNISIFFWWQNENTAFGVSYINRSKKGDYFVVEKDGVLYCYISDYTVWKLDYKNSATDWEKVSKDDFYIPTVMTEGKMGPGYNSYSGVMFESFNIIGNSAKYIYSTVNPGVTDDGNHFYFFVLPSIQATAIEQIKAKIINSSGEAVEHVISISQKNTLVWESDFNDTDKLKMAVRTSENVNENIFSLSLGFKNEDDTLNRPVYKDWMLIEEDALYLENNLEIVVTYEPVEQRNKVFGMTQYTWFGGEANGINGGSRLFLCGNTDESEQALVLWSSLDNPLYFPENNYAYVGNNTQPVTAFGKQGENLIIFKPNETYYSYYVFNNEITADDLINQTVIDYEANSVYFPIVTLHSAIGCDCPDTVQLCRNRLVWLNSDGSVYTLVSANQYSEMTIYPVSAMIERKLKQYTVQELIGATACDFEGYYMLIIGDEAWLMDYNSYGYTYVYSYSKTENANCLIPWYYWTLLPEHYFDNDEMPCYNKINNAIIAVYFPRPKDTAFKLYFSALKKDNAIGSDKITYLNSENEKTIKEISVKSAVQTKLFDFSAANYMKNIERVSIGLGNNGGVPINVTFVADVGSENETVTPVGADTDERDAMFVRQKNIYPCIRAVRKFGVKLECNGPLSVDGLAMQYRLLGGSK